MIPADTTPTARSLQTALANAYTLLTSVHPAQLDSALTALADALQGQGRRIGALVEQADAYLRHLAPSIPTLNNVITGLADVTDDLAKNAPALLELGRQPAGDGTGNPVRQAGRHPPARRRAAGARTTRPGCSARTPSTTP